MTDTRVFPKAFDEVIRGSKLDFHGYRVEASGTRGLFTYPGFLRMVAEVTDLDLTGNRIGAAGLEALAGSPIAGQITSLKLTDCALDADAVPIFDRFPALEHLYLDDNPIGPAGAVALAGRKRASLFEEVDVSRCAIGGEGMAALRASLAGAACFSAAFAEHGGCLGTKGGLMPRILFSLHGSPLGEAGVEALAAWSPRPAQLLLQHTGLTDEGLRVLAEAGLFERAKHVDLRGNPLSLTTLGATPCADGALVKTSLDPDDLRSLRGASTRFMTDAVYGDTVVACPYCREVHDLGSPLCRHCGADVTLDAGYEEPADYLPQRVEGCPHCGELCAARAMRCASCRAWLPRH